jgi:mitogen-activated protein kinase kinase
MANKASLAATSTPEGATSQFGNAHLNHPMLQAAHSFPLARGRRGGMSNRRMKPGFTLRDIDPSVFPTGGAIGAGLGAGRPSISSDAPRRPSAANSGSPFSNFSKIV